MNRTQIQTELRTRTAAATRIAYAPQPTPAPALTLFTNGDPQGEIEALRRELEVTRKERDEARRERDEARRKVDMIKAATTHAPASWLTRDRSIYSALMLEAEPLDDPSMTYWPVPHSAESIGVTVGMTPNTARKAIQRLQAAGLVDYRVTRTAVNLYGEPLDDPRMMNEDRGDRWESSTVLAVKPIAGKLPELADVDSEVAARARAKAQRDELDQLRAAVAVVEAATCPHCGEAHTLAVVCRDCGVFTTADSLARELNEIPPDPQDATETQSLRFSDPTTASDEVIEAPGWTWTPTETPAVGDPETQSLPIILYTRKVCVSDEPTAADEALRRGPGGAT